MDNFIDNRAFFSWNAIPKFYLKDRQGILSETWF